ncbi:MAG: uroporphyrinogen-III C-methyltransferase [Pseudomonadota bacterium]
MNELPPLSEQNAAPGADLPPAPASAAPASGESLADFVQRPLTIVVGVLALLLALEAWNTHSRLQSLRQDMARSLQKGEISNTETGVLARNVQEMTKELQAKVGVLENRQTEAQSQQLALEQLYQDLSKNRDEWALAEIEQVLSTASQQLQLSGNVQGALIALQNADRSLSRSDKPQFITIRRAIAKDTDKLKALPGIDLIGLALRLDNVIAQVDTLPMLADEKPAAPVKALRAKAPGKPGAPTETLAARVADTWHSWSGEMWSDVRELIRVRSVDTPEALMLSPTQSFFLRENLKLRLLNARLALLSRNEAAFRSDLTAAQEALLKYFDTRARTTQTAQALLRQVQSNNLAIDMPTLADSLNAVRNYKAKP